MNYIGVYNIRGSLYNTSASNAAGWASWMAELSAAGARQHLDLQAGGGVPFGAMANWISAVKQYIVQPYGAGAVTGVSGPNETDTGQYFGYRGLTGVPAANQAQADLYAAMKADPTLRGIPVDMWPLALPYQTAGKVGNQTIHCDRANMHDYYQADDSTASTPRGGGDMQVQIQDYLGYYREICNRANFITTETGWYTPTMAGWNGSGTNEYTQARLLLNGLFDHAMLSNNQQVYIFTLRWGTAGFSDPGWGVMHDDGTPKVSGTAIRNLMAILNDSGSNAATFTAENFPYSVSGMPAASGNFPLARSDGAVDILLWNETPIWNISTATQISIPSSNVTVSLPSASSGVVYDPVNSGTTPISTFNDVSSVGLSLNDAPLIVRVR